MLKTKEKNNFGFTLVEIMVSVSIIAILSILSIAIFSGYQHNSDVQMAALKLASDIRQAQNYALGLKEFKGNVPAGGWGVNLPAANIKQYFIFADIADSPNIGDSPDYIYDGLTEKFSTIIIGQAQINYINATYNNGSAFITDHSLSGINIMFESPDPTIHICNSDGTNCKYLEAEINLITNNGAASTSIYVNNLGLVSTTPNSFTCSSNKGNLCGGGDCTNNNGMIQCDGSCVGATINVGSSCGTNKVCDSSGNCSCVTGFVASGNSCVANDACGGVTSLTDIRGTEIITYPIVALGTQCWFRENLKTQYTPDGATSIIRHCYTGDTNCTNTDSNGMIYGGLYDWVVANNLASSCYTGVCVPSEPNQGICPAGWHMPTDAEFTTLTSWATANGIDLSEVSSLKFSGILSGYYNGSIFSGRGTYGYWWTSSLVGAPSTGDATVYAMNGTTLQSTYQSKSFGLSVRCIKN